MGGGIGTRGPGETKLEVDRRKIRDKITKIKERLNKITNIRKSRRTLRKKRDIPVVALVGYTNAGKSTLLNALTESAVLTEDKLFATLDPTTRKLVFPEGREILFTDTVGFIRKLPILLIEAFQSTLEEAVESDLLLHVVDASSHNWNKQYSEVKKLLDKIGATQPTIVTFNKIDKLSSEELNSLKIETVLQDDVVFISAQKKTGLLDLVTAVRKHIEADWIEIDIFIPFKSSKIIEIIKKHGSLQCIESCEDGYKIKASIPKNLKNVILDTLQTKNIE